MSAITVTDLHDRDHEFDNVTITHDKHLVIVTNIKTKNTVGMFANPVAVIVEREED